MLDFNLEEGPSRNIAKAMYGFAFALAAFAAVVLIVSLFAIFDVPGAPKGMLTLYLLLLLAWIAYNLLTARVVAEMSAAIGRIDRDISAIVSSLRRPWPHAQAPGTTLGYQPAGPSLGGASVALPVSPGVAQAPYAGSPTQVPHAYPQPVAAQASYEAPGTVPHVTGYGHPGPIPPQPGPGPTATGGGPPPGGVAQTTPTVGPIEPEVSEAGPPGPEGPQAQARDREAERRAPPPAKPTWGVGAR